MAAEGAVEEAALIIAAAVQSHDVYWARDVLDQLGSEAKRRVEEVGAVGLEALKIVNTILFGANWLGVHFDYHETGYVVSPQQGFGIRLQGAHDDYYNPANSCIDQVLERRRGIPITLAVVIHAAVCRRVGVSVRMLNIPGHGAVHYGEEGSSEERWIDCFDSGKTVSQVCAYMHMFP